MEKHQSSKPYDLEDRTLAFARNVRVLIKELPKTVANIEDCKQLTRSSGSVGANYIEANEAISKKDFVHRIKICRKESKESVFWLTLVDIGSKQENEDARVALIDEATQLMRIFSAIMRKGSAQVL